ncbi:hypothetical protein HDK77DRAFT_99934 [Phyllosticta capitalensis]|uniref:Uncharacterized protein n=1 Tax=Phyllosticta capitalensis TaxID=121624 RepID=A0ABR1YBP6_9PEZI
MAAIVQISWRRGAPPQFNTNRTASIPLHRSTRAWLHPSRNCPQTLRHGVQHLKKAPLHASLGSGCIVAPATSSQSGTLPVLQPMAPRHSSTSLTLMPSRIPFFLSRLHQARYTLSGLRARQLGNPPADLHQGDECRLRPNLTAAVPRRWRCQSSIRMDQNTQSKIVNLPIDSGLTTSQIVGLRDPLDTRLQRGGGAASSDPDIDLSTSRSSILASSLRAR